TKIEQRLVCPDLRAVQRGRKRHVPTNHHVTFSRVRAHRRPLTFRKELEPAIASNRFTEFPSRGTERERLPVAQLAGPVFPWSPLKSVLQRPKQCIVGEPFVVLLDI